MMMAEGVEFLNVKNRKMKFHRLPAWINICIVANMHIVTARDLPVWVLLPVWICVAWDELNPTGGGALPTGMPFWGFPFSPWYTDGREAWRDSLLKLFAIYVLFTSELDYPKLFERYWYQTAIHSLKARNLCWWEEHVLYVWKKYSY